MVKTNKRIQPCLGGRSAGSFPEQRLVIEPRVKYDNFLKAYALNLKLVILNIQFGTPSVSMGYWPSVRSRWLYIGQVHLCLSIDRDGVEVNILAKKMNPTSSHLNQTSLVNKGFTVLYGFCRNFSCATRQIVSSGQDSSILPAHGASHIIKVDFDLHPFHMVTIIIVDLYLGGLVDI